MTDEALSEVANSVVFDWNNNSIHDCYGLIVNSSTMIPGDVVTREGETTTTNDISECTGSATDPGAAETPLGVIIENESQDLDSVYSDNDQARVAPKGSGMEVFVQYAADDQGSAIAVYPGDVCVASETEPGKVMQQKYAVAALINTPTTALLRDAVIDIQITIKGFLGIFQEYDAGDATDDQWLRVRLSR